jgi:NTE family protein
LTQKDGEVGLLVTVREKNYGPPVLQPAFVVDGEEPDNVTFTAGGRLTFLDIAGYGSELRTDFSVGNAYGIATEFYKRFSQTSLWFFAPRVSASDTLRSGFIPTATLRQTQNS